MRITRILQPILLIGALIFSSSCLKDEYTDTTPKGVFRALWKTMDEHYCFFELKSLDWDSIYQVYDSRVDNRMDSETLFYLMADMLSQLRDGHVNLSAAHDISRYWFAGINQPANYSGEVVARYYLGVDYRSAAGMAYKILDDNVGYIRYSSFENGIGAGNLSQVLSHFSLCQGIIIDVRSNGGGSLVNADILASRFTEQPVHYGYMMYKTGKGHHDFSTPTALTLHPYSGLRWKKPVVVLTNRGCYSATNSFVNIMRQLPLVTIMGDKTGGGGGMPFSSELPNGWSIRFSASPMTDANLHSIEQGLEPDIRVTTDSLSLLKGIDTIIESARRHLHLTPGSL